MPETRTVVCIEDEAAVRELVTLVLRQRHLRVIGAANGAEGLARIARERPALVLLDLALPDMDGWHVYRQMKAMPVMRNVPVMVITARTKSVDRLLGLQVAQVDGYLTKPFDARQLLRRLDQLLPPVPDG